MNIVYFLRNSIFFTIPYKNVYYKLIDFDKNKYFLKK